MFNSISELQQFLEWARQQKIKSISVDNVKVEFSELSFLPETEIAKDMLNSSATTLAESETADPKEDEEALFWSAN